MQRLNVKRCNFFSEGKMTDRNKARFLIAYNKQRTEAARGKVHEAMLENPGATVRQLSALSGVSIPVVCRLRREINAGILPEGARK